MTDDELLEAASKDQSKLWSQYLKIRSDRELEAQKTFGLKSVLETSEVLKQMSD